jgi:hypothetical protein
VVNPVASAEMMMLKSARLLYSVLVKRVCS